MTPELPQALNPQKHNVYTEYSLPEAQMSLHFDQPFLALFDFVSRATLVAQTSADRPSSVNSDFSKTAAYDPGQT